MSASPTSPSNRKRQQAGASAQPQPIAPAPSAVTGQITGANPTSSPSTIKAPPAAVPTPINTDAANKAQPSNIKSPQTPASARKRKAGEMSNESVQDISKPIVEPKSERSSAAATNKNTLDAAAAAMASPSSSAIAAANPSSSGTAQAQPTPPAKKSRTNTPWTPAEERKLKTLRDAGSSWGEIAKEFPHRTEGSVKKHWYKDMHYADFAEDESAALLAAIREYEANKWKEIGKKVGKPAKACEQYAKEHFSGKL